METNGLFAHVNDSIRRVAGKGPTAQTWEFLCECPEVTCHALVSLTLNEFDDRRAASPPVPILATEHSALSASNSRER